MNSNQFQIFSFVHIATMILIFSVAAIFVALARRNDMKKWIKPVSCCLTAVLLTNELIYIGGAIYKGLWSPQWGLPLQLCDLAILAIAFCLIKHNQVIWELGYFWGLGGTLQAICTPDITVNFPDYIYIKFFITHGCIVIGVIFLAFGLGRPIYRYSIKRVLIITNIYAVFVAIVNYAIKSNYLYLCHKPYQSTVIDYLGPWPIYLIGLECILIISLVIYYMPFYLLEKRSKLFN